MFRSATIKVSAVTAQPRVRLALLGAAMALLAFAGGAGASWGCC